MKKTYTTTTPEQNEAMRKIVEALAKALEVTSEELLKGEIRVTEQQGQYHAAVVIDDEKPD